MRVDLAGTDLFNIVRRNGMLMTRGGLFSVRTPSSVNYSFVYGFSIESPFTQEVWHYLFERNKTTGVTVCRVYTEEYLQMYALEVGVLSVDPVISHAVVNNQVMINSPEFSSPLYGCVGGGLIPAVKTESNNPDTTALDIPTGHIAAFGDRMVIAQNNILFFNDAGVDPRTFVAQNTIAIPSGGDIYDLFQGDDGALYVFTSKGTFFIPQDALGRGQLVEGFLGMVPGIETTYERNAATSCGVVLAVQKDGLVTIGRGGGAIPFHSTLASQYETPNTRCDDYRATSKVYPVPEGFLVGIDNKGGSGDVVFYFNVRNGFKSFIFASNISPFSLVGTLRSRDGDYLMVMSDRVLMPTGRNEDFSGQPVSGSCVMEIDMPEGVTAHVRRVVTSSDVPSTQVFVENNTTTRSVPVSGIIVGTSNWDDGKLISRRPKSLRHGVSTRTSHFTCEIRYVGGDRRIEQGVDVEVVGQGRRRGDRR
jgi:hypothetical protein